MVPPAHSGIVIRPNIAYRCGGSTGIATSLRPLLGARTCFPFDPFTEMKWGTRERAWILSQGGAPGNERLSTAKSTTRVKQTRHPPL
jgi:hypothetical protein